MKLRQDPPAFKPITITLETREEAEALWFAIRGAIGTSAHMANMAHMAFWINLSKWFSNEARL